jgi:hypothetical protein
MQNIIPRVPVALSAPSVSPKQIFKIHTQENTIAHVYSLCRFTSGRTLISSFKTSRRNCAAIKNVSYLLKMKTCVRSAVGSFVLGPKRLF